MLRRLSVGDVNGLSWYYSCRIIDNGSAINVNTAWSRDHEFLGNGSFAVYGPGPRAATREGPAVRRWWELPGCHPVEQHDRVRVRSEGWSSLEGRVQGGSQ